MSIYLEKKVKSLIDVFLDNKLLSQSFTKDSYDYLTQAKIHIAELFKTLSNVEEVEYAGNTLIRYLEEVKYFSVLDRSNTAFKGLDVLKLSDKEDVFQYQKFLLVEYVAQLMSSGGVDLSTEHFTTEEYDELKRMITEMSEMVYEMHRSQFAADEVIYNSVEEVKNELLKSSKKASVFGKDFVIQQVAGKLIDMTVKGGAGAVLTKMSSQYSELSGKIMALL